MAFAVSHHEAAAEFDPPLLQPNKELHVKSDGEIVERERPISAYRPVVNCYPY